MGLQYAWILTLLNFWPCVSEACNTLGLEKRGPKENKKEGYPLSQQERLRPARGAWIKVAEAQASLPEWGCSFRMILFWMQCWHTFTLAWWSQMYFWCGGYLSDIGWRRGWGRVTLNLGQIRTVKGLGVLLVSLQNVDINSWSTDVSGGGRLSWRGWQFFDFLFHFFGHPLTLMKPGQPHSMGNLENFFV